MALGRASGSGSGVAYAVRSISRTSLERRCPLRRKSPVGTPALQRAVVTATCNPINCGNSRPRPWASAIQMEGPPGMSYSATEIVYEQSGEIAAEAEPGNDTLYNQGSLLGRDR